MSKMFTKLKVSKDRKILVKKDLLKLSRTFYSVLVNIGGRLL